MKISTPLVIVLCILFLFPYPLAEPVPAGDIRQTTSSFSSSDMAAGAFYTLDSLETSDTVRTEYRAEYRAEYYTYETMTSHLLNISSARPDIVTMESIGKTYEGRELWAMRVSGPGDADPRPGVMLVGAHHAREWISFEVPIAILETLVDGYGSDTRTTWIVDNRDIWIIPMLNPDGVAYMQETGNNWRKNRQPWRGDHIIGDEVLPIGVDLNRNYGYKWGYPNVATTQNPYSDTYRGPEPFSERETRAIRDLAMRKTFATCISYHSYSELILYPWGHLPDVNVASAAPPDEDIYLSVGGVMAEMTGYQLWQANELYPASGDTTDYLYATHGTISFTFELAKEFIPPIEDLEEHTIPNIEAALYLAEISDNPKMDNPVIEHQPVTSQVAAGNSHAITAEITSARDIREARVYYSHEGGTYRYVVMKQGTGGEYAAAIPGQSSGEVNYYVWAEDTLGHSSTNMKYAPLETHTYYVSGGITGSWVPLLFAVAIAIPIVYYVGKRGMKWF